MPKADGRIDKLWTSRYEHAGRFYETRLGLWANRPNALPKVLIQRWAGDAPDDLRPSGSGTVIRLDELAGFMAALEDARDSLEHQRKTWGRRPEED